jgi:hypothetical protein
MNILNSCCVVLIGLYRVVTNINCQQDKAESNRHVIHITVPQKQEVAESSKCLEIGENDDAYQQH